MANEFKIKKGLIVTGASGGTVVDIQGSQGQLFSVTDDLSGSIFAVSDISGVPILDVNSSGLVTVDGPFTQTGGGATTLSGTLNVDGEVIIGSGEYLSWGTSGATAIEGSTVSDKMRFYTDSTLALTLESSQNAIFAGDVTVSGGDLNVGSSTTVNSVINMLGTTNSFIEKDTGNHLYFANNVGDKDIKFRVKDDTTNVIALTIDGSEGGNSTFAAQAFSAATSSGDVSSTLTTKGYVDSLITGATIYRGAWDPSGGGYGSPDLSGVTQTSGYYYICSAAGTAEPNGTGTEPDTWAVGDWVIYNDVSGTGQWQKIDNSSVLSGVGTGQTVALWEGAGSVTDSETLGNAPITVSGNNSTFAGNISSTGLSVDTTGLIQLGDISGAGEGAILQVDNTEGYTRVVGALSLAGGVIFENDVEIISNENAVDWFDVSDFSLSTADSIYLQSNLITLDRFDSGNGNLVATSWDASFNSVTSTTFLGDLNGTINTATTGVTQTAGNNSTLIATTAYADAAAAAVPIGNYLPLAGGTMTGVTQFNDHTQHGDQVSAKWGAGNDLTIKHNATDSFFENNTGHLSIVNYANDKDITLWNDDGTGGIAKYLVLDGSTTHAYFSNPGNVGIGTTSNDASSPKLQVAGSIMSSSSSLIAAPTTASIVIDYHSASNAGRIMTGSGAAWNKNLALVPYGGNVGIGTAAPAQKLHVSNGKVLVDVTSSVGTELILQNLAVDQFAADKNYHEINFITSSTSSETTGGYVRIKAGQEISGNDNRSYLGFWTAPDDGTVKEKMRIDSAGNVGIGTTGPKAKLDVNGRFCVDSKAVTVTDTFTTCLTVNLSNHTGCHVVITVFGDWSGHSSAAYRGEFFLQNGANSYAEPGIILRQDDNTSVGTDQIICQIVDPTSTANPKDFQIQIRHTDTTSPASWTGQLTYTVQGQFNSIT